MMGAEGGGMGAAAVAVVSLNNCTLPHLGSCSEAWPVVECHITREVDCACHHVRAFASLKLSLS